MKFQYKNGHYNKEDDMKTLKKYSLLLILLVITGICTCCVTAEPVHAKTYKIRTASDWKNIGKKNGGTFKLMKDIKLTSEKQYLTISKNKKYTIDLNGHKVATTYSGVNLRTVCPLTVKKGTVILKSSKKNKGVLYSTEAAAVTVTGSAKFYLKSGAIVDDAVEFRSDVTSAVALADKAKCYISGASMVQSIGNGVAMLGKSKLYLTGHPYIRAGANNYTGQFTHYGNGIAENITMRLTCTSPSIEIIEDSYQCQNIAPYQTATFSNVFYFNIAENTRDMTPVTFTIHIDDGNGEKEYDIVQYIAAPLFVIKPDITYKTSGQQSMLQIRREGITDIHVQIANEGHFNSGPANLQIEIMAPFITVTSPSRMFNSLEKGSTTDVVFRVNAHNSPIADGWIKTKIGLGDGIFQTLTNTELPFGGFNESCDPGYFSTHDWQMSDDAPWATTDDDFHNGDYSAKSGVITHNESSSMSITQTTKATEISFFKKVSSEAKYDKLHFYIDDEDMGEWSGYIPWSEETYPVSQGTHTFKWSYIKDYSVDIGSDCAWVDDINIKPVHSPIYSSGGTLRACKNQNVTIDCSYAYNYQNLIWTTLGDGHFESNQVLHPVYIPGTQDKANGGTTLRLRADGGSPSDLQLILTNAISLGDAIIGDDIIDPQVTNVSHYSVANQAGIDYHWQLEPAEAGHIFPYGNDVDIIWDFGHDILEATLTVSTDATCSQPLSKAIQIDLLSVMERPQSYFSLYPNPSDGKVNLVVEQDLKGKSVVEVYNVLGHLMTSRTLQNLSQGQSIDIDLQHYAPGLYIIKLCNDEGCWSQKVSIR